MIEIIYNAFLASNGVCTDTRSITDDCIFFALKGNNFNGNLFAKTALDKGAKFAVVDENVGNDKRLLKVDNVLIALQQLANHHRNHFSIPVIAITGSNGKTTTKELTQAVLSKKYNTLATIGNLNNHIGVPLTLLSLNSKHEIAIIEMGANRPGEIAELCSIACPTHGLITNVGKAHLDGFGDLEGVIKSKTELYRFIVNSNGVVFCNSNNNYLYPKINSYLNTVSYGNAKDAYISGSLADSVPSVRIIWNQSDQVFESSSQLTGDYNFENILSAICIGAYFKVDPEGINNAINEYRPTNQRSQIILKYGKTIVLDAYNANPTSMKAALLNFKKNFKTNCCIMIGDMMELGNSEEYEHREIVELINQLQFENVVLVGKRFSMHKELIDALFFNDSKQAIDYFTQKPIAENHILIKGSRSSKMELLMELFI